MKINIFRGDPFLKIFYVAKFVLFQYFLFTYLSQTFYETFGDFFRYSICAIYEFGYILAYIYLVSGLISSNSENDLKSRRHAVIFVELFCIGMLVLISIVALASNTQGDVAALLVWGVLIAVLLFGFSLIFSLIPFNKEKINVMRNK